MIEIQNSFLQSNQRKISSKNNFIKKHFEDKYGILQNKIQFALYRLIY